MRIHLKKTKLTARARRGRSARVHALSAIDSRLESITESHIEIAPSTLQLGYGNGAVVVVFPPNMPLLAVSLAWLVAPTVADVEVAVLPSPESASEYIPSTIRQEAPHLVLFCWVCLLSIIVSVLYFCTTLAMSQETQERRLY